MSSVISNFITKVANAVSAAVTVANPAPDAPDVHDEETEEVQIPQTLPLPGMVANSAGGFTFQVNDLDRLRRFICLGSEKGTYYVSEQKLTLENAQAVHRLFQSEDAMKAFEIIENFSLEGRCAKQDSLLFCYAMCARFAPLPVRQKAYEALSRICRIPTHLFMFIGFCESLGESSGWGRLHRKSVINWYNGQDASKLAFAVTKYAQREGWSHRDVLRLCHAKPQDPSHDLVYKYVTKGWNAVVEAFGTEKLAKTEETETVFAFLKAVEEMKQFEKKEGESESKEVKKELSVEEKEAQALKLISEFHLAREHIPTSLLNSKAIWNALLQNMPMTAMLRNLNKMTSLGLFADANNLKLATSRLTDSDQLRKARIHPFNALVALKTYSSGHGLKGSSTWTPEPKIVEAIEEAFYKSFKFVEPTGKRFVLGLDVSGSMSSNKVIGAENMSAREASAALAMVTARTETNYRFMCFSDTFRELNITADMNLKQVQKEISGLPFASTDCSLPMTWALEKKVEADVFMVFTDNETYAGKIHPCKALTKYREEMKIAAKLIVVGMTSNGFTIADPEDAGMLDMCGFDANAPEVVRQFIMGDI